MKSKSGGILKNRRDQTKSWIEHFKEILNQKRRGEGECMPVVDDVDQEEITKEEVRKDLRIQADHEIFYAEKWI